jgi:hypothetical protein
MRGGRGKIYDRQTNSTHEMTKEYENEFSALYENDIES